MLFLFERLLLYRARFLNRGIHSSLLTPYRRGKMVIKDHKEMEDFRSVLAMTEGKYCTGEPFIQVQPFPPCTLFLIIVGVFC